MIRILPILIIFARNDRAGPLKPLVGAISDYNAFWEAVDSGSKMIRILPILIIFARNDRAGPLKPLVGASSPKGVIIQQLMNIQKTFAQMGILHGS
ncbi:hypothetical protein QUF72_09890 [Desulfobacterales bacterium HSG2]|nr:hypothetical protein [Desulfobacterales bacterium HSG2]